MRPVGTIESSIHYELSMCPVNTCEQEAFPICCIDVWVIFASIYIHEFIIRIPSGVTKNRIPFAFFTIPCAIEAHISRRSCAPWTNPHTLQLLNPSKSCGAWVFEVLSDFSRFFIFLTDLAIYNPEIKWMDQFVANKIFYKIVTINCGSNLFYFILLGNLVSDARKLVIIFSFFLFFKGATN